MIPDPVQLARDIAGRCLDAGFTLAGVCQCTPARTHDVFRRWIAEGRHADMAWLEAQAHERSDPGLLLPGARSVVMVADVYWSRNAPEPPAPAEADRVVGKVARYARGRDYHPVIKKRLHAIADRLRLDYPGSDFRSFADTAPVLEREFAERAGLGWIAKNTMLIHPDAGSYLVLGGMVTNLELSPPPEQAAQADACGSCTRCIDACPTGAITPRAVDASRCVSYLTVERRLPLNDELLGRTDGWMFGCDVCQEVCPHNSPREGWRPPANDRYASGLATLSPEAVLGWSREDRSRVLSGSAMKRATLSMFKRNAIAVLAEAARARPGLRAAIERARVVEDDPMVVESARRALAWLDRAPKTKEPGAD